MKPRARRRPITDATATPAMMSDRTKGVMSLELEADVAAAEVEELCELCVDEGKTVEEVIKREDECKDDQELEDGRVEELVKRMDDDDEMEVEEDRRLLELAKLLVFDDVSDETMLDEETSELLETEVVWEEDDSV